MIKQLITAAVVALGLAAPASSATLTFDIDVAGSGVSVTETGSLCLTTCGVTADLASSFGSSFTLAEGETATFDFASFTGLGTGLAGYDIDATLAFSSPTAAVSASGFGGTLTLGGSILAGILLWDTAPQTVTLSDGTMFTVAFEGGFGILLGDEATTTASVTLDKIGEVGAVPLPASALLLIGGLGILGATRRRKRA
ncbi:MAG: VPLPA-CTERM sorting domain-containing protein [Pseudomonadota bacterium]